MNEIAVHEIRDGQVLAEDVASPETGQVLLTAGVTLKRSHVELLERRGVLTVKVAVSEDPEGAEETKVGESAPARDQFADALSRLEHMFEGFDDDPVMSAIHAAARRMVEAAMKAEPQG